MIGESEHFVFNGVKSTEFGIRNVNVSEGLYSESIVASKTINETFIRGRKEPYFIDIEEEPKTLELKFFFHDGFDDRLIDRVTRWLNVDYYKPLFFSADLDRVFYVLPIDGIEKIHNGLKEGYLTLNMRCNSSRAYSHEIITPTYKTNEDLDFINIYEQPLLKIGNRGHFTTLPEIWIEKIDEGNITIQNRTNANKKFEFKNIDIDEKLYVDCKNEIIQTSKEKTYRYDDFNDYYLELVRGENILTFSDNMKIRFRYRYIFS